MKEYDDFLNGITFRYINPYLPLPRGYRFIPRFLSSCGFSLDFSLTRLPQDEEKIRNRLRELCKIPRMSTFAIAAMINMGVANMHKDHVFVNIGVWNGFTLLAGMVGNEDKKCIGVDNFSEFGGPRKAFMKRFDRLKSGDHSFYEVDYREHFAKPHKEPIGFYIYDGSHRYEDQLMGLRLAEPFMADNCIILVDDTNVDGPRRGTLDFIKNSRHEYRILLDRKTIWNGHPTYWNGIMVIEKVEPK
ncbi:MAG: hypothetical protein IEMM0002_0963 [bacterium]|nr:MAG: hypothetical protein IEMM0002_0963 [bacterium]